MSNDIAVRGERICIADAVEEVTPLSSAVERRKTTEAWSLTIEERRTSRRLEVHLPTVLRCGDRSWRGAANSISLGGVSLAFVGDVPAMLNQHIRLSFSSQTDGLGSEGIVCGIRTSGNVIPFGGGQPGSTLAVQFVQLSAEDEQVIALLLTEGRSRSIGVCVAAALVTQESEEVLLDTGSQPSVITSKSGAHSVGDRGGPRQERRRHRRVAVELASEVCLLDAGACVSLPAEEGLTGSKISLEWTRSAGPTQGSMVESVATKTCSLMGPVMWTKTERETANNGFASHWVVARLA